MKPKRLSDFEPNPMNPRTITDEQLAMLKSAMDAFGDLSGLVVNNTTGHMIGGHQRIKILGDKPVEIVRTFAKPTKRGTVAEGFVTYEGERFIYREVHWDEATEKAAMIAANKQGGDWNLPDLTALLQDLNAAGHDMGTIGFTEKELEAMLNPGPTHDHLNDAVADQARFVQLELSEETMPIFMDRVRVLGERFNTESITATVEKAVERCYDFEINEAASAVVTDAK